MESDLEEDSVPFVVRGPDIFKAVTPVRGPNTSYTVPFVVRGPDISDTVPFVARGPDARDTVPFAVRGPESGDLLGIPENNPRSGEHWKESNSLCSSGVSSMNSSLTSSGDLFTEDNLQIPKILECRDYQEHSDDDDDSRLYGHGTESKLFSSVHVHYPPSLSMSNDLTTAKPLDAPVKKADGANPELKKCSSLYQPYKTKVCEAQFPDNSDILSSFSQLSIKGDSCSYVYDGRQDTEESTGAAEEGIPKYRSQERAVEASIDRSDLMKLYGDDKRTQGLHDKLKSLLDQNKITERGKNKPLVNSQRQRPYTIIRNPIAPPSVEVFPDNFMRNGYGNVPEAVQQYEHENDKTNVNANTNNGDKGLKFVDVDDVVDFERSLGRTQVIQGPPPAAGLPHISTFFSRANMDSTDLNAFYDPQQMTQFHNNYNNTAQYMNTSNFVSEHNAFRNNQYERIFRDDNPQPQILSSQEYHAEEAISNHIDSLTNMQNVPIEMIYYHNNSNQRNAVLQNTPSLSARPPNNVANQGHGKIMHYYYEGSGTRRANEFHNSPTTSTIPSSPASSEISLPSPSSQTSITSPMMLQAQSPCPSTPEGNIPNIIIPTYRNPSLYSSNSSISSGHSSLSAKAGSNASPRSCSDQDGTVTLRGPPGTVLSPDYPHPTHLGTIQDDEIDNTTVTTVQTSNISRAAESNNADEDDDDEDDDDGNNPVHNLAYLPEDEFEEEYMKFMKHDNGSELRRSMNVPNADKRTPLYIAVIRNNTKAVKCFLDQGADPTKICYRHVCFGRDNYITYYENVLHLACEKGFEEMVDLLVDHPSKQDLVNSRREGDDKTPLLICLNIHDLYRNRLSIIKKLLLNGASLNFKETHSGKSPLMLAIEKHEIDFVTNELRKLNPDHRRELLEQTDYDGNTCLHFSAQIVSRGNSRQPRNNHMTTHSNLKALTDEQVQRFNSSLNLDGANIDAQNLEKVKPKDLRRQLTVFD